MVVGVGARVGVMSLIVGVEVMVIGTRRGVAVEVMVMIVGGCCRGGDLFHWLLG